ncbi:hypothetical protein LR48_Vigan08g103800 [Vigna angularis]|uniref:Uncharacterized protein n=1 Tax=Phaseolus angularis TaxID=3914 RepID=A0A0L9V5B5_PHAAN|nr:hypothetical protein LR48_Vigan08g103800 [Vigna angularis]
MLRTDERASETVQPKLVNVGGETLWHRRSVPINKPDSGYRGTTLLRSSVDVETGRLVPGERPGGSGVEHLHLRHRNALEGTRTISPLGLWPCSRFLEILKGFLHILFSVAVPTYSIGKLWRSCMEKLDFNCVGSERQRTLMSIFKSEKMMGIIGRADLTDRFIDLRGINGRADLTDRFIDLRGIIGRTTLLHPYRSVGYDPIVTGRI